MVLLPLDCKAFESIWSDIFSFELDKFSFFSIYFAKIWSDAAMLFHYGDSEVL